MTGTDVSEEILNHYREIVDMVEKEGKNLAFGALNVDDIRYLGEGNSGNLLERLSIEEVLCFGDRRLLGDKVGEGGKTYDRISFDEKIPVCFDRQVVIAQDGLSVFDDVGGLTGYCEFLKGTYGKEEYDGPYEYGDKKENLEWAKSLGWTGRMCNSRTML